jgi:hypothetical protein
MPPCSRMSCVRLYIRCFPIIHGELTVVSTKRPNSFYSFIAFYSVALLSGADAALHRPDESFRLQLYPVRRISSLKLPSAHPDHSCTNTTRLRVSFGIEIYLERYIGMVWRVERETVMLTHSTWEELTSRTRRSRSMRRARLGCRSFYTCEPVSEWFAAVLTNGRMSNCCSTIQKDSRHGSENGKGNGEGLNWALWGRPVTWRQPVAELRSTPKRRVNHALNFPTIRLFTLVADTRDS